MELSGCPADLGANACPPIFSLSLIPVDITACRGVLGVTLHASHDQTTTELNQNSLHEVDASILGDTGTVLLIEKP